MQRKAHPGRIRFLFVLNARLLCLLKLQIWFLLWTKWIQLWKVLFFNYKIIPKAEKLVALKPPFIWECPHTLPSQSIAGQMMFWRRIIGKFYCPRAPNSTGGTTDNFNWILMQKIWSLLCQCNGLKFNLGIDAYCLSVIWNLWNKASLTDTSPL